jgi:hypothetical protein
VCLPQEVRVAIRAALLSSSVVESLRALASPRLLGFSSLLLPSRDSASSVSQLHPLKSSATLRGGDSVSPRASLINKAVAMRMDDREEPDLLQERQESAERKIPPACHFRGA